MNWFRKATITMGLDWDTAYKELMEELERPPTNEEVRKRMLDDDDVGCMDTNISYEPKI